MVSQLNALVNKQPLLAILCTALVSVLSTGAIMSPGTRLALVEQRVDTIKTQMSEQNEEIKAQLATLLLKVGDISDKQIEHIAGSAG